MGEEREGSWASLGGPGRVYAGVDKEEVVGETKEGEQGWRGAIDRLHRKVEHLATLNYCPPARRSGGTHPLASKQPCVARRISPSPRPGHTSRPRSLRRVRMRVRWRACRAEMASLECGVARRTAVASARARKATASLSDARAGAQMHLPITGSRLLHKLHTEHKFKILQRLQTDNGIQLANTHCKIDNNSTSGNRISSRGIGYRLHLLRWSP